MHVRSETLRASARSIICVYADVSEPVQEHASGACVERHEGSNPSVGTEVPPHVVVPDLPLTDEARRARIFVKLTQQRDRCLLSEFQLVLVMFSLDADRLNISAEARDGQQAALKPINVVPTGGHEVDP